MTPYPLYLRQEVRGDRCLGCQGELTALETEALCSETVLEAESSNTVFIAMHKLALFNEA